MGQRLGPDLTMDGGDYIIDEREKQTISANGHKLEELGTLQGKLPWHPTFSKESPYSTDKNPGGDWKKLIHQKVKLAGAIHLARNRFRLEIQSICRII